MCKSSYIHIHVSSMYQSSKKLFGCRCDHNKYSMQYLQTLALHKQKRKSEVLEEVQSDASSNASLEDLLANMREHSDTELQLDSESLMDHS